MNETITFLDRLIGPAIQFIQSLADLAEYAERGEEVSFEGLPDNLTPNRLAFTNVLLSAIKHPGRAFDIQSDQGNTITLRYERIGICYVSLDIDGQLSELSYWIGV